MQVGLDDASQSDVKFEAEMRKCKDCLGTAKLISEIR